MMRPIDRLALAAGVLLCGLVPGLAPATAQERPNMMIVFDASGSMWGQIGGRTKIDLAREALSSVLSEADAEMDIGMIAYGHRVRGQCSDIELVVPPGPAVQTVPQILGFANRVNPRGMTPLTDAVLIAAQRMGYAEQAATVVLLTDGIETCSGDPCALGRRLAAEGIDFRAHVVGFDLSDAEQRQVSCLAEETGGLFLAANDADELRDALARTLSADPMPEPEAQPEPEPEPAALPRQVTLILRDVAGGPVLTGRPFRSVELLALDAGADPAGRVELTANPGPYTGRVALVPGSYRLLAVRQTEGRNLIRVALPVEIPPGTDPHTLDLVIAARLQVNALLHAGRPMPDRQGRLPRMTGQGWAEFRIHPVVDGAIDPAIDYGGINSLDVALPPGEYFIRGTLSQTFTRERLVTVTPGETTVVDFDFAAAPVTVDLRDAQGFPIDRPTLRIFDLDAAAPFASGHARTGNDLLPAWLPPGHWRLEVEGRNARAAAFVTTRAGEPLALSLTPGAQANPAPIPEDAAAQCLDTHSGHGCVVHAVSPIDMVRHLGLNGRAVGMQVAPRYTGTWQTHGGMMALVQEGRRVWGEVHVNGGIGLVWGHVAPDGLTLRGAMDRSSSPRGAMELRIDAHADRLVGFWDQNIGRAGQTVTARRLSGGVPPLTRATGTGDDLRLTQQGQPWAPADSAEFAAFMDPALAPASPDTGEDIDAMQQFAPPMGFHGIWNTSHGRMELRVEGRSAHGLYRGNRPLIAEISADGRRLRGIWLHENGREWGTFALELDAARMAFTGGWGRNLDPDLRGGAWTGTRIGWLAQDPTLAVIPPSAAGGAEFDAFMAPVRDADLPSPEPMPEPAPEPAPEPWGDRTDAGTPPDLVPYGLAGFTPALRFDYTHPDGRPAASFVFADAVRDDTGWPYWPGYVWLMHGWCGPGCAADILPVGGSSADEVPNAPERLDKGGVFPALELSALGILAFDADGSDWRNVTLSVVVMDRPYNEGEQPGQGDARVTRRFGPFTGGILRPATLDGWPVPEGADRPGVGIGTLSAVIAPGIYSASWVRAGSDLDEALHRMASDMERRLAHARSCADTPFVVHPDGVIAGRSLDPDRAARGGAPYVTTQVLRCAQGGPVAHCDAFDGDLVDLWAIDTPAWTMTATVVPALPGGFALRSHGRARDGDTLVLQNCLTPVGALSARERAPSGRLIVDHIADREDGGDSPVFDDAGQVTGTRANAAPVLPAPVLPAPVLPAPAPPNPAMPFDFAAAAGLYGARGEGCAERLLAVRADRTLEVWDGLAAAPASPSRVIPCDPDGRCHPPGAPAGVVATIAATATGLELCNAGNCPNPTGFDRCPPSEPAPDLRARILRAAMAGPGPVLPTASSPDPGPAAGPVPPGLWHVQAPWSDPMPAPGSAAFVERCLDEVRATFPDGLTLGFMGHVTAGGPLFEAFWAETCQPSGDPDWPFVCTADDGHVADADAAGSTARLRVDRVTADRVELTLQTGHDPEPGRYVLHACVRPDGLGIDLDGDARGRALARAVASARGDGGPRLDLAALQRPAVARPAPAPAPGPEPASLPETAPPAAPRGGLFARPAAPGHGFDAALAGLWFPIHDGRRPDELDPDEVAAACFETPGRFHPDGLFVAFHTQDGLPRPDSHMRCDATLACSLHPGGPVDGAPADGQVRILAESGTALRACLGPQCVTLARCPAPDWSPRERASGLAARWEAAVAARD